QACGRGKRSCEESSCRPRLSRRLVYRGSKPGGPGLGRKNREQRDCCVDVQISERKKVGERSFVCLRKKNSPCPRSPRRIRAGCGGEKEKEAQGASVVTKRAGCERFSDQHGKRVVRPAPWGGRGERYSMYMVSHEGPHRVPPDTTATCGPEGDTGAEHLRTWAAPTPPVVG
ncbi:unnamed protein product, partial [Ectocarpus sp. 12 AP-2014]